MPPTDKKLYLDRTGASGRPKPVANQGRRQPRGEIDPRDLGTVEHDHRGDAVWNWHVRVPGQRDEDPTIDFLEALEVDGMSIEDDADSDVAADSKVFNPYDKER
jgi:hypothetical protein